MIKSLICISILTGCYIEPNVKTITMTNYVTMPAEFGPDGYGYRHLSKEDSKLVSDALLSYGIWNSKPFFEDLTVSKTVTQEPMSVNEIMQVLSHQPNVASVSYRADAKRSIFSLSSLAYPQYEYEYQLTADQWKSLQEYCRIQLIDAIAVTEVVEHWKSITNGVVPFGLKVRQ